MVLTNGMLYEIKLMRVPSPSSPFRKQNMKLLIFPSYESSFPEDLIAMNIHLPLEPPEVF